MRADKRGMALVSVVLILAVLMILALILVEKIWQATHATGAAGLREKTFWAANTGLERARHELAATYRASHGWQTYLQASSTGYPANPTWQMSLGQIQVDLFLRDNPDGDDDLQQDNDLQLFVLARARSEHGPEILIEARCELVPRPADVVGNSGGYPAATGATAFTEAVKEEAETYDVD